MKTISKQNFLAGTVIAFVLGVGVSYILIKEIRKRREGFSNATGGCGCK